MKQRIAWFFGAAIALSTMVVGSAWADGPVILGYTDSHGNLSAGGQIPTTCVKEKDGVKLTIHGIVLIRDVTDGAKGKFTEGTLYRNPKTGDEAYRVFEKSDGRAYATATGPNGWKFDDARLDGIRVDQSTSIASSSVSNGNVTFHLQGARGKEFYAFNGVHIGSDGTHSWLGVEGTEYTVHNVNGKPLLLVGGECQKPSPAVAAIVKGWL